MAIGSFRYRPDGRASSAWSRGLLVGVTLPLAVSALLLLSEAAPAPAALHNPIPADESGDPNDSFTDADALFAYVTSDLKGGHICIVAGSVTDPNAASCDHPAWGTENTVLGIGTTYTPVEGPPLEPGTWRLLVEDSTGAQHELSEPFTVTPCPTCPKDIPHPVLQAFKDAAQTNGLGAAIACAAQSIKDFKASGTGARGVLVKIADKAANYDSGPTWAVTIISTAGTIGGIVLNDSGFDNPGEAKALEILKSLTCSLTLMYADIAADPPDPNFTEVPQPEFSTIPTLASTAATTLARAIDEVRAFGLAELTAYERFLGAQQAGQAGYVHAQAAAIAELGEEQVDSLHSAISALRAYAAELDTLPDFADPVTTAARRDQLVALYQRIQGTGFTSDELSLFHAAGLTDQQIADLRTHFSIDLTSLPADTTLQSILRTTADGFEAQLDALDGFAREGAAVAGRTNLPPVASFTATPSSGPRPLQVQFTDTSTSPDLDPIASLTWDFGDGSTGAGSTSSHTYTADGSYAVTETVCDYLTCGQAQQAIRVGQVNRPPAAVDDTLTVPVNSVASLNVLLNDSDPDGDSLTVTGSTNGAHGTVNCQPAGSCTYVSAAGYSGPDAFTYTISDGHGGTANGNVSVTVSTNTPPTAVGDSLTALLDRRGFVNVLANDSDVDGDALTVTGSSQGAHGAVSCAPGGGCIYRPANGYTGPDSFTYTISDGFAATATATVAVAVRPMPLHTQAEINTAIARGVEWLDTQQQPGGSFGFSYPTAETALAIVAYGVLDRGDISNLDPSMQDHLRKAVSWLLGQQDPDSGAWPGLATYNTGLALEALAFSPDVDPGIPAAIAQGRTYLLHTQQAPPAITGNPLSPDCSTADDSFTVFFCGGWNYEADNGRSDESNTGFALTGLALTGGVPGPAAAINLGWQRHVQELKASNPFATHNDGGGDYQPGVPFGNGSNANDTGSLVFGYGYDGAPASDAKVHAAVLLGLDVLDAYMLSKPEGLRRMIDHSGMEEDGSCIAGAIGCDWHPNFDGGYHYSLWALTKGLGQYIAPELSNVDNWYPEVVDLLLSEQSADGWWPQDGRDDASQIGATSFAVSALRLVGVPHTLTVTTAGSGSGTVTSTPAGINCPSDCSETFADATQVTLTARAANGSSFAGWSGACSVEPCSLTMNGDKSVTATFNVGVTNRPPVASNGSATTDQNVPVPVTLVASDPDGDPLSFAVVSPPGHGTLGPVNGNKVTYTPATGYIGPDSFTFKANDGKVDSNVATVSITVTAVNHAPVAQDGSLETAAGSAAPVMLQASDPDGDALTYTIVSGPAHGTLTGTGAGRTYTPSTGYSGPDSFTFKANDGQLDSNVATVSITVRPAIHTLIVALDGSGSGSVASTPGGISCGTVCSATFEAGRSVSLHATPDSTSGFAGWGGACSGTADCILTMDAPKTVTATFVKLPTAGDCNRVGHVHGNQHFKQASDTKDFDVHVEADGDCDFDKKTGKTFLHHAKVKVTLEKGGTLIDAKQDDKGTHSDVSSVTFPGPGDAVITGTWNGIAFTVTLHDGGKGKQLDTLRVRYGSFDTSTLTSPHGDVHIDEK